MGRERAPSRQDPSPSPAEVSGSDSYTVHPFQGEQEKTPPQTQKDFLLTLITQGFVPRQSCCSWLS